MRRALFFALLAAFAAVSAPASESAENAIQSALGNAAEAFQPGSARP